MLPSLILMSGTALDGSTDKGAGCVVSIATEAFSGGLLVEAVGEEKCNKTVNQQKTSFDKSIFPAWFEVSGDF